MRGQSVLKLSDENKRKVYDDLIEKKKLKELKELERKELEQS